MRRRFALMLALTLLLCGCGKVQKAVPTQPEQTAVSLPAETVPPDGNSKDVTCKGTYSVAGNADAVAAKVGEETLTNRQLAVWYWAVAAQYRQSGEDGPDFDRPLDAQLCDLDTDAVSWQQYFLGQALNAWHTAAALKQHSRDIPLATEEAYEPNLDNYAEYMDGMPATKYLYGYNPHYSPNSMHQAYLDNLPETLQTLAGEKGFASAQALASQAFGSGTGELEDMAQLVNYAYMYFTELTYDLETPEVEEQDGTDYVNFRHILLLPGQKSEEETLAEFKAEAKKRVQSLTNAEKHTESAFSDLAHFYSQDTATSGDGGAYRRVSRGQLPAEIEAWCFDAQRQPGDTTVLNSADGIHILYFSGWESADAVEAADKAAAQQQAALLEEIRSAYPMEVSYSDMILPAGQAVLSVEELLYPDIAHERFPEVPLYLQQDYPHTMYGGYPIRTNGCGITSMAMLASYLADDELTPPEMCAAYGRYSHRNGTDGMIFVKESPVLGFYLMEKTYEPTRAWEALEDGHLVISIQHNGYWTRGGHYIVLEKITDSGKVQVRDSNLYNYRRISAHVNDEHTWGSITSAGSGFWIFDDKLTRIAACTRCGGDQSAEGILTQGDFYCRKCAPALMRRNTYLTASLQ